MIDEHRRRFSVHPLVPFQLEATVWALRRRSINAVDVWSGEVYRRVLTIDGKPVLVAVTQRATVLDVTLTGTDLSPAVQQNVTTVLERLLGINVDLSEFYTFAVRYARLNQLVAPFRGFKPPRFATVFEGLVNGITCQQLSLAAGITFLNRLAERYGQESRRGLHAFPRPEDLAHLHAADLRPLGFSGNKARSIIGIAQAIVEGDLDLEELDRLSNKECFERLVALYGVGRWTAEYVLLRALGRTNVFPGDDVGARNNLERWLRLGKKLDYNSVQHVLHQWKDFGGLIFLLLLLKNLHDDGWLSSSAVRISGEGHGHKEWLNIP
jgi:DNA-3-methyladenine glycosylase II